MPTVYILQEAPGRNLTPALKFGTIKVLLPPGDISQNSDVTQNFLLKVLRKFDPEHDSLVLMGSPSAIYILGQVMQSLFGKDHNIRVLKWDRQYGEYLPTIVEPINIKENV